MADETVSVNWNRQRTTGNWIRRMWNAFPLTENLPVGGAYFS